jgi:flagellar motor component MotA
MTEHNETVKHVLDVAAVFTTLGTFLEVISPVFGLIGAVVGVMRIAEMLTGKPFSELIGWKKDKSDAVDE